MSPDLKQALGIYWIIAFALFGALLIAKCT